MNLEEGLKKGIDIYVNEYLKLELGMNTVDYTYELDFEKNWIEFHMHHGFGAAIFLILTRLKIS